MQRVGAFLLLTFLVFAVFAQGVDHGFLNFDDQLVVTDNSMVREGLTPESILWSWTTGHFANWMPLTWMSHQLDAEIFGDWAGGHHLTSVILHWLGVLLLFDALRAMTGRCGASLLVAAIYAVHPLHVESVAWISERKGILSTFFWMLGLRLYASFALRPSVVGMGFVTLAMIGGLLSKQMLVTLPVALLLLDLWPLKRWDGSGKCLGQLITEKIPLFVAGAGFAVVAYEFQTGGDAVASFDELPLGYRLANAAVSAVVYLRRAIWPSDLAVFYPHPLDQLPMLVVAGSAALLTVLTAAAVWSYRRIPFLTVGWFWYLATLTPVIGLVQVGSHGMADRYTDIPLVGIYVAVVWGISQAAQRLLLPAWLRNSVGMILVTVLAMASAVQTSYWRSSETLFEHILAVDDDNYMALNQLGALAESEGDIEKSRRLYSESIAAYDGFRISHANLGRVLLKSGQVNDAVVAFARAAELGDASAALEAARVEARRGRSGAAKAFCRQALEIAPDDPYALGLMGQLLSEEGRHREALPLLARAAVAAPSSATAHQRLAAVHFQLGNFDDARDEFVTACRLDASILERIEAASAKSADANPLLLDVVAACQSNVGSMQEAVVTMKRAIEAAKQRGMETLLPELEPRLKQYESNNPYRPRPK